MTRFTWMALFVAVGCGGKDEATDTGADTDLPTGDTAPIDPDPTDPGGPRAQSNGTIAGECPQESWGFTYPYDYEFGQWAATVIPITDDGELTAVSYVLRDGFEVQSGHCDAGHAHRIALWKGSDGAPAATPTGVVTIDVPAGQRMEPRVVEVDLPAPITVSAGEFVVLAVEMVGDAGGPLCIRWCDAHLHEGRNWWSYATAPPYAWGWLPSEGDVEATLWVTPAAAR